MFAHQKYDQNGGNTAENLNFLEEVSDSMSLEEAQRLLPDQFPGVVVLLPEPVMDYRPVVVINGFPCIYEGELR